VQAAQECGMCLSSGLRRLLTAKDRRIVAWGSWCVNRSEAMQNVAAKKQHAIHWPKADELRVGVY